MKLPRANDSKAAVALRKAALAFAAHANVETEDQLDRKGQRLNRKLLGAAVEYARTQDPQLTDGQRTLLHRLGQHPGKQGLTQAAAREVLSLYELQVLQEKGYVAFRGRGWGRRLHLTEAGDRALWARTG